MTMLPRRSIWLALVPLLALAAAPMPAFSQSASLTNPAALTEQAPADFKARFDTGKGTFVVEVHRDWAPHGADRFYNLVKNGFFDNARFFRVISGFMVQFGINGDPKVAAAWRNAKIQDDPVKQTNARGAMTFAMAGPKRKIRTATSRAWRWRNSCARPAPTASSTTAPAMRVNAWPFSIRTWWRRARSPST